MTKVRRKRNTYSIKQKKVVVDYVKQVGRNQAASHFELDASMVRRWVKASSGQTETVNQNYKRVSSGRKPFYPEAEKKLYDWIIGQRKQGLAVTYAIVKVKMLDILKEDNVASVTTAPTTPAVAAAATSPTTPTAITAAESFKTSDCWISSFLKRYNLTWRRRTRVSQKLPAQTEESLERFHQFITRLRIKKSFELHNILNMDETPVWFDMAGNFTIDQKGGKTVHIRATGNEKNRFTVVLTCAAGKNFK